MPIPVPTSVMRKDDGLLSFEWRFDDDDEVVTIEVVEGGWAEFTRFKRGRVVGEMLLGPKVECDAGG